MGNCLFVIGVACSLLFLGGQRLRRGAAIGLLDRREGGAL
jgi:hypothetical protein